MVGIPRCVAAGSLALLSPSPASRTRHAIVSSTPRTPHGTPHRRQETRGRDRFRFAYTACAPAIFTNSSTRTTQTGNPAVSLAPSPFVSFAHSRRPQGRHGPPRGARRRQQEPPCLRLRASSRCADRVQRRHVYHDTPSVGVNVARGRNSTTTHRHRDARASSRCNWHSRNLVQRRCEARDGVDGLQSRIALSSGSARPPTRSSSGGNTRSPRRRGYRN
ncbi:hypothetical protein DFH09DRAFT_1170667 [Mycena vulgaris]|nr:hypothetical protein DFH09DRAFT_1170667 [Mycena vulgaris]